MPQLRRSCEHAHRFGIAKRPVSNVLQQKHLWMCNQENCSKRRLSNFSPNSMLTVRTKSRYSNQQRSNDTFRYFPGKSLSGQGCANLTSAGNVPQINSRIVIALIPPTPSLTAFLAGNGPAIGSASRHRRQNRLEWHELMVGGDARRTTIVPVQFRRAPTLPVTEHHCYCLVRQGKIVHQAQSRPDCRF